MKKPVFNFILCALVVASPIAQAQFDDPPVQQSAVESRSLNVSSDDLKQLSSALATKNEDTVLGVSSRILGKNPKHLPTLNALGVFYFENKKPGLAKIFLNRALADYKNEPALHNNLGVIYLSEGKQRQAIAAFRRSLELKSNYTVGATNLASIYLEYEDYTRALAPLEDSYKTSKSSLDKGEAFAVEIANNYAMALAGIGEHKKSEKVYEEILKSNSSNTTVLLNYAILLIERLNNPKAAISVISKIKFVANDRETLNKVDELEKKMSTVEQ